MSHSVLKKSLFIQVGNQIIHFLNFFLCFYDAISQLSDSFILEIGTTTVMDGDEVVWNHGAHISHIDYEHLE